MARKKIAILGGGMGALSTAYALTSRPRWQQHYDITVYQLGWRLGGKCASAREQHNHDRNLEHGLHVWLGCYHNAFRMLRDCYVRANWDQRSRLGSVDAAVSGVDEVPCMDYVNGRWYVWPLKYPHHPGKPGEGLLGLFSLWKGARATLRTAHEQHQLYRRKAGIGPAPVAVPPASVKRLAPDDKDALAAANDLASSMSRCAGRHSRAQLTGLMWLLDEARVSHHATHEQHPPTDPLLHRLWVMADLGTAIVRGLIADDVLLRGYESIDHWEFRDWLSHHGAHETTLTSGLLRELYDAGFSYRDGVTGSGIGTDWGNADLAAGTAVYSTFQISINYAGSVCYELNAGMGEVVIAPLFAALRDAGVRFEFFQRVKSLKLNDAGTRIAEIHVGQQVALKRDTYDPIVEDPETNIPTWPDQPIAGQIRDAGAISGVNLESYWNGWADVGERVLKSGDEFDEVVLAISIAGLPEICADLTSAPGALGERWSAMFDAIKTTQTQSAELWLNRSLEQTGWDAGALPVDAGPEPFDVWADVDQVLRTESWPADGPKSLSYLCGPLAGSYLSCPPNDTSVPALALADVQTVLTQWLENNAHSLWPALQTPDGGFDWDALYDPEGRSGAARLQAQYLRANIDPSERYVLSVHGSAAHRMNAGDTLLDNLVVAGDWTRTAFNAGNVEAAVLSGLAASHVIAQRSEGFWVRLLGNVEAWLWRHGLWSRRGWSTRPAKKIPAER